MMKKENNHRNTLRENGIGWAFIAPSLIIFLSFIAFPFLFSLYLSLTEWNFLSGFKGIKWVGLGNFMRLGKDIHFKYGFKNIFIYAVATVPISIFLALVIAYLVTEYARGKRIFRLVFMVPYISNTVALSAVFSLLFRDTGTVNALLGSFGIAPIKWFANPSYNKFPIVLLVIWTSIGFNSIIYSAALQNVPISLYEAATIDGANRTQKFFRITLPMVSSTTFYLLIVRLITSFKIFASISIMTNKVKALYNTSMVMEIYVSAFENYKFGYASAEAVVLFVIIMIVTLINFVGQKRWVHY